MSLKKSLKALELCTNPEMFLVKFIYLFYFIFCLFNVGNKNIQLKVYRRNSFSIKRKC